MSTPPILSQSSSSESLIPEGRQEFNENNLSSSLTGTIHSSFAADVQDQFIKEFNKTRDEKLTPNALLGTYELRKNKSTPDLRDVDTSSKLLGPGRFRRHHINSNEFDVSSSLGQALTPSTLDFILLYGNFAGGYYFEESSDEDIDEEQALLGSPSRELQRITGASVKKTYFLLMKSFIGTGILFLPRAFLNGGLIFSVISLLTVAFLTNWGMLLVIQVTQEIPNKSFGDVALSLYGPKAKVVVLMSIIFSQLGFCISYFVFVAHNLRDAISLWTNCAVQLNETWLIFGQIIFYIPLSLVRKIHYFSYTSIIADLFILAGVCYVLAGDFDMFSNLPTVQYINSPDKIALFLGTAVYTFEGVGLIIPISQSMAEPLKMPKVLSLCMFTVSVVYTFVGAVSYMSFGEKTETIILLNLKATPMLSVIQMLYVLAIILSLPLQLFPALRILEQGIFPPEVYNGKHNVFHKWQKNIFRIGLVSILSFVAWAGQQQLELLVTFIGAFACIPLSFCWPAVLHFKAVAATRFEKTKDVCLFIFGLSGMLIVCAIAFQKWASGIQDIPLNRCSPIN
eukprot:NODE_30_length_32972_cov_0.541052.p4 type:complete len:567 gc:universal NODE_30_length_32972_cov_0.541052:3656-5356(+)